MQDSGFIALNHLADVRQTTLGIAGHLGHERFRVDVITSQILRVKISRGGEFDESPSYALAIDPVEQALADGADTGFSVEIGESAAILTTSALVLTVSFKPFGFTLNRTDGTKVFASHGDGYAILNNDWKVARTAKPEDAIYGLGEKTGRQNRRGRDFHLWNTDVLNPNASGEFTKAHEGTHPRADNTSTEFDPYYVSIPFFYHQDAATGHIGGSFIDNGYRSYYDFTPETHYSIFFSGGQYTEYLFAGPSMADILRDYTWLTGRTQLPPIWALGYHQCRWHEYSQQDVLDLAAKHRALDIPVDTLWLDIDYMDGYRVFTWNDKLFPDVASMLAALREDGIRVITIIDPGVKFEPGYEVFDAGLEREVFCLTEGGDIYIGQVWPGNTAFPDFVNPEAREWWGDLNAKHVESGIAGIWNDMNEPATGDISPTPMRFGKGEFSHERYHNAYAMLMAMGTEQGLRKAMPELRTFILSRAGSLDGRQHVALGSPLASDSHGNRTQHLGSVFCGCRHRWVCREQLPRALCALDSGWRAHPVCPQPQCRGPGRPVRHGFRHRCAPHRPRGNQTSLPPDALPLQRLRGCG
jgi:alpha-glucosidase